jgi:hypothetical protein
MNAPAQKERLPYANDQPAESHANKEGVGNIPSGRLRDVRRQEW